jgi:outer membrane biosynthesis protein TonB
MKRVEYLNAIVKHHRSNSIPYDINTLSSLSIKELRDMSASISPPKTQSVVLPQIVEKPEPVEPVEPEQVKSVEVVEEKPEKVEKVEPVEEVKVVEKVKPSKKSVKIAEPEPAQNEVDDLADDVNYLMDLINGFNNDIKHLTSLYDRKSLTEEDREYIYDAYNALRDELDTELSTFELPRNLKLLIKSTLTRNKNLIQLYV